MHWTGKVTAIAFSIGGVDVAWYGLIITCAMLLGLLLAILFTKRIGLKSDDVLTLFLCAIPIGIIGARLGYVISHYESYFVSPYDWDAFVNTIAIWEGGLTIMWGVPFGVIGGIIWAKITKKDLIKTLDILLPIVLLCQAIGRWGNFCNQELYGQLVTDPNLQWFPYSVFIASEGAFYQATFFYESVLNLIGFGVLSYLVRHLDVKWLGTLGYVWWYSLVRGSLEFIRDDGSSSFDGAVNWNIVLCYVLVAVATIIIAVIIALKARRKEKLWIK